MRKDRHEHTQPTVPPREGSRASRHFARTLYRYEKDGRLPRRLVLGPGASGWRLSDLERYLDELPRGGNARRGYSEVAHVATP